MTSLANITEGKGVTSHPQLHLKQIGLFLWQQGIELFPEEKDKDLEKFISETYRNNEMSLYLWDIWEKGALSGGIVLYLRRIVKKGVISYSIEYYPQNECELFFDENKELSKVQIKTTAKVGKVDKFFQTTITDKFIAIASNESKNFGDDEGNKAYHGYDFMPAVFIPNIPQGKGKIGRKEFEKFTRQLEDIEEVEEALRENAKFFGSPIFYSSRSLEELISSNKVKRYTVIDELGYGKTEQRERIALKQIIDNLEEGERIGFATPEAIPKELPEYILNSAIKLRFAMGSVDETLLKGDNSATTRQTMAPAIATAQNRANTYIKYGLCKAFQFLAEMAKIDGVLKISKNLNTRIKYRYLGSVYQPSPNETLTNSIIARNLLRLGVSVEENLKLLFPDKTTEEIQELQKNGLPYEFLVGIAEINEKIPLDLPQLIDERYLNEQFEPPAIIGNDPISAIPAIG